MTQPHEPTYVTAPVPAPARSRAKLLGLVFGGLLLTGTSAGTFAAFTASTTNDASFASGTLILSNTVDELATCFSSDAGVDTNDAACDEAFDVSVTKPGDQATADVDLGNDGSIDGILELAADGTGCVAGDAPDEDYSGTADPCDAVMLTIEEFPTAGDRDSLTNGTCVYPAGGPCTSSPSATLDTFATAHPDWNQSIDLGDFATGTARYFRVAVELDDVDNSYQGRYAQIGLKWRMVQT